MDRSGVERNESSKGGSAKAGVFRAGGHAVGSSDERHDFFEKKVGEAAPLHSQHHRAQGTMRHIFPESILLGIVDAHNDHGRDLSLADQAVGGFIDLPLNSREGCRRLEEILSVVEVEDRIAPASVFGIVVLRRQPNTKETGVAEDAAAEFMQAQIT